MGFDLRPLLHPGWWGALLLLLVNDNLLKGSGWLPGWLTGKLSDFAFLVVAPVLLAAMLPVRGRRIVAFGAVGAIYVGADLSPTFSDALVQIAAAFGLGWRLWPDLTDLIALLVLPMSWRIASGQRPPMAPAFRRALQPLGLAVGTFACLATSAPPRFRHQPFMVNRTSQPVDVTITWVLRKVGCQGDLSEVAAALSPSDLDDPRLVKAAVGQVAALDQPPAPGESPAGRCTNLPASSQAPDELSGSEYGLEDYCMAALVEVAGGPGMLVRAPARWYESDGAYFLPEEPRSSCAATLNVRQDPGHGGLSLLARNNGFELAPGGRVELLPLSRAQIEARPAAGDGCRELREQIRARMAAAAACTADRACTAVPGVPIPAEGTLCYVYVHHATPINHFEPDARAWRERCFAELPELGCPTFSQVAVCQQGRCTPVPMD
jgi:hypothetical protein